ncbi:hypothetical protein BS47DRAFT_1351576, partial [Hydnum rufescens UP504]
SLTTEGTADPKDSPAYSRRVPYYQPRLILTRLCRPILLHHSLCLPVFALLLRITHLYEIHLRVLRYILHPAILLHLIRMAPGPEVPLISLTFGIHEIVDTRHALRTRGSGQPSRGRHHRPVTQRTICLLRRGEEVGCRQYLSSH